MYCVIEQDGYTFQARQEAWRRFGLTRDLLLWQLGQLGPWQLMLGSCSGFLPCLVTGPTGWLWLGLGLLQLIQLMMVGGSRGFCEL